jgi:hypothetical protein
MNAIGIQSDKKERNQGHAIFAIPLLTGVKGDEMLLERKKAR